MQMAFRKEKSTHKSIFIRKHMLTVEKYYDKTVKIIKLNVDENNNTAIKYAVRSIPTLILFKDSTVQAQHIGSASKAQLKEFLDSNL